MAEDFIESIYHDAMAIEYLKEYVTLSRSFRVRDARITYNKAAAILEEIIRRLSGSDRELAVSIQDTAVRIMESFDDAGCSNGLTESDMIPLMYKYMSYYTDIEVDTGRFTLKSSDTGFLTIIDNSDEKYIHDRHDPMWEAYISAGVLYDPNMECISLLGSGLGYLPYQLWSLSGGAIKIRVYEDDPEILKYAYDYGVLGWIPEENLDIISEESVKATCNRFVNDIGTDTDSGYHISAWKKEEYAQAGCDVIVRMAANKELDLSMHDISTVNLRKNKKLNSVPISELLSSVKYSEWIVVAAGPSFNTALPFIRDSKGKRGIIAVNTVLRRLCREGIVPDLSVAADRYGQLIEHIRGIEEYTEQIPLVADYLTNWNYTSAYRGPVSFVSASGSSTVDGTAESDKWNIGGTISSMAVEAAIKFDAQTVYLAGLDLAYPGGEKYAAGMPHTDQDMTDSAVYVNSVDGGMVPTSETFCWFREAIEAQIAAHPNIKFINMSENGALIKGTMRFIR